jgi:signal transduction histidine kinase|tara:strand:- start:10577 stop:11935 length:1359 start_codon:yes stop_codon:yes gene_type:complete
MQTDPRPRRYLDSSSFKMALLFTILLSLSAAILGYFLVDLGKRDFLRESEAAIDIEISMMTTLADTGPDNLIPYLTKRAAADSVVRFRYEGATGERLAGTIDALPESPDRITEGVLRFPLETAAGPQDFAAKIHTFADGSRVIVARNVHDLIASYDQLRQLSALIMVLMLAVIVVSFAISYFVVSRINRIAAIARNIVETGDLSQRLSIDSEWDDLSNLSQVLNGFLDRIENLMRGIREVSNNIAHDLRTPLSGLRSDIEALKNQPVDEQKIDALLVEADRILGIFHALLRITNIEQGRRAEYFREVNLSTLLTDVADLYEPLAEERGLRLETELPGRLRIRGDGDLLFQMFANLLDNAIKFSPAGGLIRLSAGAEKGRINALIEDQGSGIAESEKANVFKHFYRGDSSRSTPGNGLGLSLVKAVAELHQARILLEDAGPGLRARLIFQPYQ